MRAIAAVVLGGTSLAGGRGAIGGTIIGAFVIGVLGDGMVMMGVSLGDVLNSSQDEQEAMPSGAAASAK